MKKTINEILNELQVEFPKIYKAHGSFIGTSLGQKCIDTIKDKELLEKIIFANDILKVPPVKTFLLIRTENFVNLTNDDKQGLGAFWGWIFKYLLKYQNQRSISISTKTVKTATYFFDKGADIEIVNE